MTSWVSWTTAGKTRSVRDLSLLALLLGLCLLTAIGFAARRSPRARSSTQRALGSILVGMLPLALVLHLLIEPPAIVDHAAFVLGVLAFGAGAFLIVPWDGEDDRGEAPRDPDPAPWWPAFERDFRAYSERRVRV